DVGIQRALHQVVDALTDAGGCILEHVDERVSDDRSLLFRILDTSERAQKPILRANGHEVDAEVRSERAFDLITLVEPQKPRVDENARELIPDRAVHESRSNRGVDTAGQATDH